MSKNKNENTKQERFEFVLRINKNIICQRYFEVKGFNEEVLNSYDLKTSVDNVVDLIEERLKLNTRNYLWRFHSTFDEKQDPADVPVDGIWDNGMDIFDLTIKMDGKTLITRPFYGNYYPPRIRYQVDIKDMIPYIVDSIRDTLSAKKFDVLQ